MPQAAQPGMMSVLFDFVYGPDLANRKQNIITCYYGPRVWQRDWGFKKGRRTHEIP